MPMHMLRELDRLKKLFLNLSALVEDGLRNAVKSALERDRDLAMRCIEKDHEIDMTEVGVEEECLKTLALYQPVAHDLRYVVAMLKINHDMERVGDLAVNIAERAVILCDTTPPGKDYGLADMARRVQIMLRRSIDALLNYDVALAREIWLSDDGIDEANRKAIDAMEAEIERNPSQCRSLLALIGVSRTLERIGDHATNIAKDVIYMIEGEIVRHRSRQFRESATSPGDSVSGKGEAHT